MGQKWLSTSQFTALALQTHWMHLSLLSVPEGKLLEEGHSYRVGVQVEMAGTEANREEKVRRHREADTRPARDRDSD